MGTLNLNKMMKKQGLVVSLLLGVVGVRANDFRCESVPGQEAFNHICDHPTCEYSYKSYCQLKEGQDPFPHRCIVREGFEAFAEYCIRDQCESLHEAFCIFNDGAAPTTTTTVAAPTTTTTQSEATTTTSVATTTTTTTIPSDPDAYLICLGLAAKGSFPDLTPACAAEVLMANCLARYNKDPCNEACAEEIMSYIVQRLGGVWDAEATPGPTTTTTMSPTDPTDPDHIPFEHNITPRHLVSIVPWGVSNYLQKSEFQGALLLHAQIVEAIKNGPPEFKQFCGTGNKDKDLRECAAFFANVCKETGGLESFEESTGATYCTHLGDGDTGLQEEGLEFPCCVEEDKVTVCADQNKCPYGCKMHGRGAIQLTWNFNYGRFSEFYYGDREALLRNPGLIDPTGPSGWAASIWFWMTPQKYGGACPPPRDFSFELPEGVQSCHDAMHDEEGGGFGQTIRIINGGYEACQRSGNAMGAIHRVRYFLFTATDWDVSPAEGCSVGQVDCDVSGVEFWNSSEGRIGNPQIGFKQDSTHCPDCGVPSCTNNRVDKFLCGWNADDRCIDPLKNTLDPTCTRSPNSPSAHPAPWE